MKEKRITRFSVVMVIALFALPMIVLTGTPAEASGNRDLIIALDTSMSMIGYGGKNIFGQVKDSLKKFVDGLQRGDSITIINFDEAPREILYHVIKHDSDRELITKIVDSVEAKGQWTHTMGMVRAVLKKAQELEEKDRRRKQVIVMLTDGLDDPPPSKRGEKFDIKEAARDYIGREWFIYLVNFGDLKDNERFKAVQRDLMGVSDRVMLIEGGDSPEGAVEGVGLSVEEQRALDRSFFENPLFIALIIITILVIVILLLRIYAKVNITGNIEYYNHTLLDPYSKAVNLSKMNLHEITIGHTGAYINIRDFEISKPFALRTVRQKGKVELKLLIPEGVSVEYVNREPGEFLSDGDVLKIANYCFTYTSGRS